MFGIIPDWAIGVGVIILFIAIGQALAVRLLPPEERARRTEERARRKAPPAQGSEAINDVQRRLSDLEAMQTRLAEVEERLDFAERLLAKQRDAERIVPPRS